MNSLAIVSAIVFLKWLVHRWSKTVSILFSAGLAIVAIALLPVLILKVMGIDGPLTDILLMIAGLSLIRTELYHYAHSTQHVRDLQELLHKKRHAYRRCLAHSKTQMCSHVAQDHRRGLDRVKAKIKHGI